MLDGLGQFVVVVILCWNEHDGGGEEFRSVARCQRRGREEVNAETEGKWGSE